MYRHRDISSEISLILCLFSKMITVGHPWDMCAPRAWVLGQIHSARYVFPPVEQTSNSMRHQLVTPISFMPPLCQWAYFTALVIVVFTAGKTTDGFTPPSAYIAPSSPAKWTQQKGSFLVLFDQSVWHIQQQDLIPKFWWPIKISGSGLCCFWRGLWVAPDLCNSMSDTRLCIWHPMASEKSIIPCVQQLQLNFFI